ncbi:MAG: M56 family metallopeptidase [Acidimicrobiales bacterium]
MIALGLLVGAVLLPALPVRRAGRRLPPRLWAALCMTGTVGAAIYLVVALLLLSMPVVLGFTSGSSLAAVCDQMLQVIEPGGPVGTWCAAGLLVVSATVAAVGEARRRQQRVSLFLPPQVGVHRDCGDYELVTLPTTVPLAYSLGGRHRQVVISDGLRQRLDDDELAAVLAHEAAHLAARHDLWLVVTTVAERLLWFVPWARRSAAGLRGALECWADEVAASQVGADALQRALLAAADCRPSPKSVAGLNGADVLAERLEMLDAPPQRHPLAPAVAAGLVGLVLASGGLAAAASGLSELYVVLTHLCPL